MVRDISLISHCLNNYYPLCLPPKSLIYSHQECVQCLLDNSVHVVVPKSLPGWRSSHSCRASRWSRHGPDRSCFLILGRGWDGRVRRPVDPVGVSYGGWLRDKVRGGGVALEGWVLLVTVVPFMVSNGSGEGVATSGLG